MIGPIIAAIVSAVLSYTGLVSSHPSLLGATIYQTAVTDTINTFRTNVNSSLSNLNTQLESVSTTVSGIGTVRTNVAGNGISVVNSGSTSTITNAGVTQLAAGTGISLNATSGAVTLTNTGLTADNAVTSIVAGTGITASSPTGTVTLANNGVTSVLGASSTIVSNATGTVTIGSRARKADFTLVFTSSTNTYDDYLTTFDTTSTLKKIYIWTLLGQYATTTGSTVTLNLIWDGLSRSATSNATSSWHATSTDVTLTTSATITNFASSTIPQGTPLRLYSYNASSTEVGITIMYDEN